MKAIIDIHKALCDKEEPEIIVQAPIVCTLFGAFADACQGYSILSCGNLHLTIAISRRKDNLVRVFKSNGNDKKRFALNALRFRKEDRWANYVKAIIAVLIKDGHSLCGMNITLSGEGLEVDSTSLSTSCGIATILALDDLFHLNLNQQTQVRIVHQANTSFNNETCRIGDILTILNGIEGQVVFFDHQHSTCKFVEYPFHGESSRYKSIIFDSKVPSQAMIEENLLAHKLTNRAFHKLQAFYKDLPKRDIPESDITSRIIPIEEKYRQACSYVLRETKITLDALHQLEQNDVVLYGRLMNRAQVDLRDKLEVTCPEVDWLTKRASEIDGCIGAKLVFNGISGSVLVMITEEALPTYLERMEDYGHIFGFNPTWKEFYPQGCAKILYSSRH